MNSAGGRCHDHAHMWAWMKEELIYGRHKTERMTVEKLKTLIFRYFFRYWNNRRASSYGQAPEILRISRLRSLGIDILTKKVSTNIDNIIWSYPIQGSFFFVSL